MSRQPKMGGNTALIHAGRDPMANHGIVNPPVYHASTILFPSVADLERDDPEFERYSYGRSGTPTSRAFEDAMAVAEGGAKAVCAPSGLSAIVVALQAFVGAGDHILVTDAVYGPTRGYCTKVLARFGVEVEFYDPRIGGGIAALLRPETRLVYTESPSSLTFEVQDIPAIAAAAHANGSLVLLDNTWASPLYFKPFEHGVDISIHAATKYIVGHSDAMMGVVVCSEATFPAVKQSARQNGVCAGPDDVYLALRGLRTLHVRLPHHQEAALQVARWLQARPEVKQVLHPALPQHPDHGIWKRDFLGSSGLFGVVLNPVPKKALCAMLDGMKLFGMGYSWGGFESLILPSHMAGLRTAKPWTESGPLLRLHVGLEDVGDLIADLEAGFARMEAAK